MFIVVEVKDLSLNWGIIQALEKVEIFLWIFVYHF